MGIFKSLFGGKKEEPKVSAEVQEKPVQRRETPVTKTSSSDQDLLLLAVAENYKVGELKYPEYFRSKFGVGFPNERFQKLEKDGFIRQSTAAETLPHLKGTDLKTIASQFGIKTCGKKDELCIRIAETLLKKL